MSRGFCWGAFHLLPYLYLFIAWPWQCKDFENAMLGLVGHPDEAESVQFVPRSNLSREFRPLVGVVDLGFVPTVDWLILP